MVKDGDKSGHYLSGYLAVWFKIMAAGMITMVAFEAVAVATAMPFVVEKLHGEQFYALAAGIPMAAQLVTTAFAGPWVDAKGPHQVMYVGIVGFLGGLLLATAAPDILTLVIGRAVQGLGGGLLIVPLYVMVGSYVLPRKQPAFFATFAMAWVLPSLVGPLVAGLLVDYVHWRWVFGITPLIFVAFFPFLWPKFRRFPALHESKHLTVSPLLLVSIIVSGVLVGFLQVISGTRPQEFSSGMIALTLALSAGVLFFSYHILPTGTFLLRRGVPATVVFRGLVNGTFIATETYLPLMLKIVHHWGPTGAGLVLTASGVTWALGSWLQARIEKYRTRRLINIIGPIGQLAGTAITLLALLPDYGPWWVLGGWCLAGLLIGSMYPYTTVNALGITPAEHHGEVSSALTLSDTLGAAILIAYAGIVYALTYPLGPAAFAFAIGLQMILILAAIFIGPRIFTDQSADL